MASFEEDLAYANKILHVRTALEDKTYLSNPIFHEFARMEDVYEYHMKRETRVPFDFDDIVIGYHEKRHKAEHINYHNWDLLIYNNSKKNILQRAGHATQKTAYQTDEVCEEWHFQQSLIVEPDVLTSKVIFNILDSVPTRFEYFQLRIRHLDDIIKGLDLE